MNVIRALIERCPEGEWLITPNQSVKIGEHSEPRPDVSIFRLENLHTTPVPVSDVLLVAEVVWANSVTVDRGEKKRIYARGGIPAYWVIDAVLPKITLTRFHLGRDNEYRADWETAGAVKIDDPWDAELDLPAWTAMRDDVIARQRD